VSEKRLTEEHKRKISEAHKRRGTVPPSRKGVVLSEEHKNNMIKSWTEERRGAMRIRMTGKNNPMKRLDVIEKHKKACEGNGPGFGTDHHLYGTKPSEESKRKGSATRQGISFDEWTHYVSFDPYHSSFNEALKESIRNRDERKCVLCDKSEILNGRRLANHHINGDKMDCRKENLASLCILCNNKNDTIEKEFLIMSKLGGVSHFA